MLQTRTLTSDATGLHLLALHGAGCQNFLIFFHVVLGHPQGAKELRFRLLVDWFVQLFVDIFLQPSPYGSAQTQTGADCENVLGVKCTHLPDLKSLLLVILKVDLCLFFHRSNPLKAGQTLRDLVAKCFVSHAVLKLGELARGIGSVLRSALDSAGKAVKNLHISMQKLRRHKLRRVQWNGKTYNASASCLYLRHLTRPGAPEAGGPVIWFAKRQVSFGVFPAVVAFEDLELHTQRRARVKDTDAYGALENACATPSHGNG